MKNKKSAKVRAKNTRITKKSVNKRETVSIFDSAVFPITKVSTQGFQLFLRIYNCSVLNIILFSWCTKRQELLQ